MAAGGTQGSISRACGIAVSTNVKSGPGRLFKVHVLVAGTTLGAIYDVGASDAPAVSNWIAQIPNNIGYYDFECPLTNGLGVYPGSGQYVTVTYA